MADYPNIWWWNPRDGLLSGLEEVKVHWRKKLHFTLRIFRVFHKTELDVWNIFLCNQNTELNVSNIFVLFIRPNSMFGTSSCVSRIQNWMFRTFSCYINIRHNSMFRTSSCATTILEFTYEHKNQSIVTNKKKFSRDISIYFFKSFSRQIFFYKNFFFHAIFRFIFLNNFQFKKFVYKNFFLL